jgi:hypothetical protein
MNIRSRKIDVIIIIALIIIASIFLYRAGYIAPQTIEPDISPSDEDEESLPPPIPPESLAIPSFLRAVSAEDEGVHFDRLRISREWWYWSAILGGEGSELEGWSVVVSFNHMAHRDLRGTFKPDLFVVTLQGPNGEQYGGMINKKRGIGIIFSPTLEAKSPGVSLKYEDSWAEGRAPEWHVHAEDQDIDKNHEIIIDLDFFAPSDPYWTLGEKVVHKSNSKIANYMFSGCNVTGFIKIDGKEFNVKGTGYHEHSWSPNIVSRKLVNGWDWFHMTFENGWNIYFSNYYPFPQFLSSSISRLNPMSSLIFTSNQGKTLTLFNNINSKIIKSDRILPFIKLPSKFNLKGKPGLLQPILRTYNLKLDINIETDNTYDKIWKFPTYMAMRVSMSSVTGTITWSDGDGDYEVNLNGIATVWSMRALL